MKIATFNIKHGALSDGYRGRPNMVEVACGAFHDVDILALQEVDKGVIRSGLKDLGALAAKTTGMNVIFAPTMSYRVGSYGNALLVRGGIEDVEVLDLGTTPRFKLSMAGYSLRQIGCEPRNAILATARIGDRQVSVAATHLSTERETGKKQLSRVLAALALRPEPHVLLGDLNQNRSQVLEQPLMHSMELVDGGPTFPYQNPKIHIDHIAIRGLELYEIETKQLPVSDHLALLADVE